MATIDELKARIDLHELAERLGLERPGGRGNYRSPSHDDKSPSLSIYRRPDGGGWAWKDFSTDEGGSCIDLVMLVQNCDAATAVRVLHEMYNLPLDRPGTTEPRREKSRAEYIADRSMEAPLRALDYLVGVRKLSEEVVRRAIGNQSVGFNDWTSDKVPAGKFGHGGPAAAFLVRSFNPGHLMAVDLRYLDPDLNGGTKTQCQGEKHGYGWTSDLRALARAHTVYVVESPINALTIECAGMPGVAAFATRGTGNVGNIDWSWCHGKRVLICMDNDKPFPEGHKLAGYRPGLKAAWELHEILLALDISAMLVDQAEWEVNDINDLLRDGGVEELRLALKRVEPWLIPGMPGEAAGGKPRLFLPFADFVDYSRFRVREDFTSVFSEQSAGTDDDGKETKTPNYKRVAGFRVAALSRLTVQSALATVTGDPDTRPTVAFAAQGQVPRHGAQLTRVVMTDQQLYNLDLWAKIGPVWDRPNFFRMVNILERAAFIGSREVANFVGLCYRSGRLVVSEGPDTYFRDPIKQCPYHNLIFPSGPVSDAKAVIEAYQSTFKNNAALQLLVWALGAHLKVFLGFWPHMQMQAAKGHGKSTLATRLERTIGMTVFSKQAIGSAYRMITSTSATSHPVGWEEISHNKMEVINAAQGLLQEAYNFKPSPRGAEMLEYLTCAPVLLVGEDVPVRDIIGKLVRVSLTNRKGPQMPDDLPRFPVRQWLEFLTRQTRAHLVEVHRQFREHCIERSRAPASDAGATRMADNYAAVLTAWRFLSEFAGIDGREGGFVRDLIAEMNGHVQETGSEREPWVWILELLLSEIAATRFAFPYLWDTVRDEKTGQAEVCLLVRTAHVMDHISSSTALREKWHAMPVKSDRVFKSALKNAGVIVRDDVERVAEPDGLGNRKRLAHMVALGVDRLAQFGLYATPVGRDDLLERATRSAPAAPALAEIPE